MTDNVPCSCSPIPRFAAGVKAFQDDVFPRHQQQFEKLSQGQAPEAIFITCADSRIDPALITQTSPGELFVCRNAGNIVVPYSEEGNAEDGMAASIEFAVTVLKTPHIVICGHTGCGAMQGALNPDSVESLPLVRDWLRHAAPAVEASATCADGEGDDARMDALLKENILLQLRHLKTHPAVQAGLADQRLTLHGWLYDIKTGDIDVWSEADGCFTSHRHCYVET